MFLPDKPLAQEATKRGLLASERLTRNGLSYFSGLWLIAAADSEGGARWRGLRFLDRRRHLT